MCLFIWCSPGIFRFWSQLRVACDPDAVTYRVGTIKPELGGQSIQVFQHRLGEAQVNSRNSHADIVEAGKCTRVRCLCVVSTCFCTSCDPHRVSHDTLWNLEVGRK